MYIYKNIKPKDQTKLFLQHMISNGLGTFDFGLLKRGDTERMQNRLNLDIDSYEKTLSYCRFKNWKETTDIFFRPHCKTCNNFIFADDVTKDIAYRFASAYACILVNTSREGGFQLWITTSHVLNCDERLEWQRTLVPLLSADPGCLSGQHYGRLPGFTNHKRGKQWCNLVAHSLQTATWQPGLPLPEPTKTPLPINTGTGDRGDSEREFGFACHSLRFNQAPDDIIQNITERARGRGKKNPEAYARRTVQNAMKRLNI